MKFYKDIVDELDGAQQLSGKSAQYPFHYHSWSTESIIRFWTIWTTNGALKNQFYPIEYWQDLLEWARSRIRGAPSVIADVGCGNGNLIDCLLKVYPHSRMTGIDMSEESLVTARSRFGKFKNIGFQVGSLIKLPFPDNSLDLLTCTEVLEHSVPESFFGSFSEVRRVLRNGGYYLASIPLGEKPSFVCCPDCGSVYTPYQHMVFDIAQTEVKELLSEHRLELIAWYQAIDRTVPTNVFKKWGKSFLINRMPRLAKRLFPKAGVSGFLARARE
jgi:ubiquinone/menaquinone biosynthesis C-methylase UbiE